MEAKTSLSCKRAAKNAPFCFRVTALSQFARLFLEPQKYGSTCLTTVLHCFSHGFSYLFTLIQFIYSFIVDLRFYANLSNPPSSLYSFKGFSFAFSIYFHSFCPVRVKNKSVVFPFLGYKVTRFYTINVNSYSFRLRKLSDCPLFSSLNNFSMIFNQGYFSTLSLSHFSSISLFAIFPQQFSFPIKVFFKKSPFSFCYNLTVILFRPLNEFSRLLLADSFKYSKPFYKIFAVFREKMRQLTVSLDCNHRHQLFVQTPTLLQTRTFVVTNINSFIDTNSTTLSTAVFRFSF